MSDKITRLNDLIHVLVDGRKFYEEASTEVRPDLRQLFSRMASTKAAIVDDLQKHVAAGGGKPEDGGSTMGSFLQLYAEVRASIASDRNGEYVIQLEAFEDRILEAFRDAAANSDDPEVRAIAQRHLAQVTRDHDDMRALKRSTKAA